MGSSINPLTIQRQHMKQWGSSWLNIENNGRILKIPHDAT